MRGTLAGVVLAALAAAPTPAVAEPSEAELKAEFVERFTRFVDWSDDDLPESGFAICVLGDSPVTPYLEKIAKKKKLHGRTATVTEIADADEAADCQVVLVPGNDKKRLRAVLRRTDSRPILTISETSGAAALGYIINFYRDDTHVKFEINATAAKDSGLKVRSKLLRLARVVRKGGS